MDFNFIIDPKTNNKHSIFSKQGKNLLKLYLKEYMTGGTGEGNNTEPVQGETVTRNENRLIAQHNRELRRRNPKTPKPQ